MFFDVWVNNAMTTVFAPVAYSGSRPVNWPPLHGSRSTKEQRPWRVPHWAYSFWRYEKPPTGPPVPGRVPAHCLAGRRRFPGLIGSFDPLIRGN